MKKLKYSLEVLDKMLRKAREENKIIVFNFSGKELEYIGKGWIVINV